MHILKRSSKIESTDDLLFWNNQLVKFTLRVVCSSFFNEGKQVKVHRLINGIYNSEIFVLKNNYLGMGRGHRARMPLLLKFAVLRNYAPLGCEAERLRGAWLWTRFKCWLIIKKISFYKRGNAFNTFPWVKVCRKPA